MRRRLPRRPLPSAAAAGGAPEAAASNAPDEFAPSSAPAGAALDVQGSEETRSVEDLATPTVSDPDIQAAEQAPDADPSILGFEDSDQPSRETLTVERSPWPMVLFTGVALMIGALLLRWILVPRAG